MMSPAPHNTPANGALIIAAVRTEAAPLLRRTSPSDTPNLWRLPHPFAGAWLAITGMGAQRMTAAAEALIERLRPARLINVGFAAGLDADLAGGDVVMASELVREGRQAIDLATPTALANLPRVRLLSTDAIAASSTAKRQLAATHQAAALDLEAYDLAELAQRHSLPLLVLKAISDPVDMSLPAQIGSWVDDEGRPRLLRPILYAITHPQRIGALIALQRHCARGAIAIAGAVSELLANRSDATSRGAS